jgi:endonuclease YncB( thermonuclease family)
METPWIIAPEAPDAETLNAQVLKVFDGDGVLASLGHLGRESTLEVPIRFGFIDAPELDQPGGREAHEVLRSIVERQQLDIVPLMKDVSGRMFDRWGRLFGVPYLHDERVAGGFRNIELEMVLNGWAWVLQHWGPDPRYAEALNLARQARRGIWARNDNVAPWVHKKRKARRREAERQQPNLFGDQS